MIKYTRVLTRPNETTPWNATMTPLVRVYIESVFLSAGHLLSTISTYKIDKLTQEVIYLWDSRESLDQYLGDSFLQTEWFSLRDSHNQSHNIITTESIEDIANDDPYVIDNLGRFLVIRDDNTMIFINDLPSPSQV